MSEEVIAGMRARVQQLRKVISLAHDQRMIDALQQVIDSGEADIKKLEKEAGRQA
jgi:predicted  nucleic acid-binding Zn-ribbon protein